MQSLRAVHRLGIRAPTVYRSMSLRMNSNISGGSMGRSWSDKEKAEEKSYFNKKDAEMLAKLAAKLKNHTEPTAASLSDEREALKAIFTKHNTPAPDALVNEILKFKFNEH